MPGKRSDGGRQPRARRRARRALVVAPVAITAVGVSVQSGAGHPAGAFPQDPHRCEDRTIQYYLHRDWDDYPQAKQWAQEAIGRWNQPLDFDGSQLVEVTSTEGAGEYGTVGWLFNGDEDEYGFSDCPPAIGAWFEINVDHIGDREYVWQVAKHEIGHLMGAEHTGALDSHNSDNPPIMASCWNKSFFNSTNILTQDDYSYMSWLWSSLPERQLTANMGFEQGTSFWGAYRSTLEWQASNGATGPGHVRYKSDVVEEPSGARSYYGRLYQTVNLATGDDTTEQYRLVANYKSESSDHRHFLPFTVLSQQIDYQSDNGNDCDYADGLTDLNDPIPRNPLSPPGTGFGVWMSKSVGSLTTVPPTTWTWVGSSWVPKPYPQVDGMRLQIDTRPVGLQAPPVAGPFPPVAFVHLDNIRIEGT
jgi:hypothetical protein